MSIFLDDILNSMKMPSQAFQYQTPEPATAINAKIVKPKQKQAIGERKRKRIADSFSQFISIESYDSAHYMQQAVDNLMLALAKETEQVEQTKIQFVLAKAQHILLKEAGFELDFQSTIQNQIQDLQVDFTAKFQKLKTSIVGLQATKQPTTNQLAIAKPASQLATTTITTTVAKPTANSTEKPTAKSAAKPTTKPAANPTKPYAQIAIQDSQ